MHALKLRLLPRLILNGCPDYTVRLSLSRTVLRGKRWTHNDASTQIIRTPLHIMMEDKYNKGLGFTIEERQLFGVHGLMPCSVRTNEEQMYAINENFDQRKDAISKYVYLLSLRNRVERMFFTFLNLHTEKVMPIIYTPTVGTVCSSFALIYRAPMGLFITIYDRGHVAEVLRNWREKNIRAVCVTDGGRILGLGDLGANGMGIAVGKLALYTAVGGVPPSMLLPVTLDVGTDNKELLNDPLYVGARIPRVKGPEYEDFVQEFMEAVVEVYGRNTFIHFEDFATPNAFKFLSKYQGCYSYFNDDIQGTAATGLAGFLGVERLTKRKLEEHVFLFAGAGSAAIGIARLLLSELVSRGMTKEEGCKIISVCDATGLITNKSANLSDDLKLFAKDHEPIKELVDVVDKIKPSILLGATGTGGLFSEQVLRALAKHNKQPAVFAMSNPTTKAECTAEQAYKFTEGRVIFAAGSPFPPVLINERRILTGQANNCFVFPGVALGAICARAHVLPDEVYTVVARSLANYTSEENLAAGSLYPSIKDATDVAFDIGVHVAKYIIENGLSNLNPLPKDVCEFVRGFMYRLHNERSLPNTWKYPEFKHLPLSEKKSDPEKA